MRRHFHFLPFLHPPTTNSNAPSCGSQKNILHLKSPFGKVSAINTTEFVLLMSRPTFVNMQYPRLIAGMFECHDKSRFDVTAISLGPDDNSEMRQRLKASFERFIDVKTYSDDQIANLVRSSEVDILVDLMGFTADSRTGIFARRPAPIQVNYLGYLGTMGAEYIDYIIADRIVIPETQHDFYAEKIVYLPNSFQPTDRQRRISDKKFTRAEAGLPQEGFVFCCFNTNYKITPDVFDIWMRILKQVDGSVLVACRRRPNN